MLLDAEARRHGETRGEKTFEMNEAASTAVWESQRQNERGGSGEERAGRGGPRPGL